jgi:hypothetical protein
MSEAPEYLLGKNEPVAPVAPSSWNVVTGMLSDSSPARCHGIAKGYRHIAILRYFGDALPYPGAKAGISPTRTPPMVPSLAAHLFLKGSIRVCSWDAGWRSVLLREFEDPPCVDAFTTAATSDYFLSLVTKGSCHKSTYGETPLRRLTRFRMAEARRLLVRNTESVTEVGLRCGYGSPSHFAAEFRRHVGVSPTAYRAIRHI